MGDHQILLMTIPGSATVIHLLMNQHERMSKIIMLISTKLVSNWSIVDTGRLVSTVSIHVVLVASTRKNYKTLFLMQLVIINSNCCTQLSQTIINKR